MTFPNLSEAPNLQPVAATKPFPQTTRRQSNRPGNSAAQQVSNKPRPRCQFCGLKQPPRSNCSAKKDICHKCSKAGHWASVCRSTAAVIQQSSDDEPETVAVLCSTGISPATLNVSLKYAGSNEQLQAMIDTGSTVSFISASTTAKCGLNVRSKRKITALANGDSLITSATAKAKIEVNQMTYHVLFTVAKHLVADVTLGLDVLRQHHSVRLELGGDRPETVISAGLKELEFPAMKIAPPTILSKTVYSAKPIATKSRRHKQQDIAFMESEVNRMPAEGTIQVSTSPWQVQAFVVRDGPKPRMVIDYSQTINRHTSKDAFPFPNMQDLLDQAAENTTFSKIDLKSAYHQIPLHRKDMSFTAFEVNGQFGVTNTVAAFQREMTPFVRRHNLKRTHPYLDDVIIGGRSEEEHQENLKNFLETAKIEGLTLNKAKCVFGCKTVPMLGHYVGAGSKRPDPSGIKTLMDFPIPENSSQLKRLLGFFGYNEKWIADYSNKVAPLLAAQKQLAFPLNQASRLAIAILKKEVA